MSARRQSRRQQDRRVSADRAPFVSPKGRRSTATTPRDERSGGEVRRPGAGQGRGPAHVARQRAARVHPSRARDASASRGIGEVAVQTTTQMSLVQDDHVVEKLTADSADHSLGEGVLPRRSVVP